MLSISPKPSTYSNKSFFSQPLGGRISFVDLAGSESLGKSGAVDEQAKQAGTINQGLLVLRRVVDALAAKQAFIPYRDSKLTLLLQVKDPRQLQLPSFLCFFGIFCVL